jgi:hypothetical protein
MKDECLECKNCMRVYLPAGEGKTDIVVSPTIYRVDMDIFNETIKAIEEKATHYEKNCGALTANGLRLAIDILKDTMWKYRCVSGTWNKPKELTEDEKKAIFEMQEAYDSAYNRGQYERCKGLFTALTLIGKHIANTDWRIPFDGSLEDNLININAERKRKWDNMRAEQEAYELLNPGECE